MRDAVCAIAPVVCLPAILRPFICMSLASDFYHSQDSFGRVRVGWAGLVDVSGIDRLTLRIVTG